MKRILILLSALILVILANVTSKAELGTSSNTLFLWHFDGSSTVADYAKANQGPITATQALRSIATDSVKFGTGSYPMGPSGPNKKTTTFPIYKNGQWLINPHECTIDYWIYYPTDLPQNYFGMSPGYFMRTTTVPYWDRDLRVQVVSGSQLINPYFISTTNKQIMHGISYSTFTAYAPVGRWNHLAWTWSSMSDNSYYFVNGFCLSTVSTGVSAATNAISDAQWREIDTDIADGQNGLGWYVQGLQGNGDDHGMASARMDELRISDIDRYGGQNFTPPIIPYPIPPPPPAHVDKSIWYLLR